MFVNHPTQDLENNPFPDNLNQTSNNLNTRIIEAESSLGYDNPYLFLRSTWKMRSDPNASLDDRFDRLNKIVGMVKSSVKLNTAKEIASQQSTVEYQEISSRQAMVLQKMNRLQMQKQEFLGQLIQLQQQNQNLKKINCDLSSDVDTLKKQKHELQRVNKDLIKKNIESQNKFLEQSLRVPKNRDKVQSPRQESFLESESIYSLRQMKEENHKNILEEILPNFRQNIMASPQKGQKLYEKNQSNRISQGLSEKQNSFFEGEKLHVPKTNLLKEKSCQKLRFKSRNGHQSLLESPINQKFIRTNKFHSKYAVSGFQS